MRTGTGSDSTSSPETVSTGTIRDGAIGRFVDDERGSYTLWSLVWFMLYAAFGGLAVDVTDAYRNQTLLQSTADAAALAAVMSLEKMGENPVAQANAYAATNMDAEANGDVLTDSDITFGNYDLEDRTFTAAATPTNAVHVVTRRAADNGNPVSMNFLRILGLFGLNPIWNVTTESIAVQAISICHNHGLIAGGTLEMSGQNSFYNNICLHGGEGMLLRNDNFFESGVSTSTLCTDCVGPEGSDPSVNEGWDEAWARGGENDPLFPLNALVADQYVDVLKALPDTASYSDMIDTFGLNFARLRYLFDENGAPPTRRIVDKALPDTLEPYSVYVVNCNGNVNLPSTPIRNVGIVTTCTVQVPASQTVDVQDVSIIADFDSPNPGIKFAGNGKVGHPSCKDGTLELYTTGSSIDFAAGGDVSNVRLISAKDIAWSAQANGPVGVMAEAIGNISMTSQASFGLCENKVINGPNQYTYRLVL